METLDVKVLGSREEMPEIDDSNFFHSRTLFDICTQTPGYTPYMVVIEDGQARVLCHLLAIIRRRGSLLPPYLYSQCRVYGEGVYASPDYPQEELFVRMLKSLTQEVQSKCLYIEFSHLSDKMFAYRYFRRCNYFPVHWMAIHNSLHSHTPEERITDKMKNRIMSSYANGVTTTVATTNAEMKEAMRLLKNFYRTRLRRYCPPEKFFYLLVKNNAAKIFIAKYKDIVISASVCIFSENNAYMIYLAHRKNRFPMQHAKTMVVWATMKYAERMKYQHIYFMDVGLPFKNDYYRDFILKFGGKPASTNRWFRCRLPWLNAICKWLYR
jgi:hypothetical protein